MSNSRITAAQHSHNSRITTAQRSQYQNDGNEVNRNHHHLSLTLRLGTGREEVQQPHASDIEAQRAARRAAMPITSALVEQYADFGAKVVYASENGITVGKKPQDVEVFTIPNGYFPSRPVEAKGGRK